LIQRIERQGSRHIAAVETPVDFTLAGRQLCQLADNSLLSGQLVSDKYFVAGRNASSDLCYLIIA
jgi:hypothetical protein